MTTRRPDSERAVLSEFCDWVVQLPASTPAIERFQGIIRLLVKFALRHVGEGRMPADEAIDIIVSGWLGYDDRFDPDLGFKYSTYIGTAVRNMLKDPRHRRNVVHLPVSAYPKILACVQAREDLRHELGRHPSLEEVAERAGVDRAPSGGRLKKEGAEQLAGALLRAGQIARKAHLRLDFHPDSEEDYATVSIPAPEAEPARELPALNQLIAGLSLREKLVIVGRYRDGRSLREIGESLGVSAERIRQIQNKALKRLRETVTVDPMEVYA